MSSTPSVSVGERIKTPREYKRVTKLPSESYDIIPFYGNGVAQFHTDGTRVKIFEKTQTVRYPALESSLLAMARKKPMILECEFFKDGRIAINDIVVWNGNDITSYTWMERKKILYEISNPNIIKNNEILNAINAGAIGFFLRDPELPYYSSRIRYVPIGKKYVVGVAGGWNDGRLLICARGGPGFRTIGIVNANVSARKRGMRDARVDSHIMPKWWCNPDTCKILVSGYTHNGFLVCINFIKEVSIDEKIMLLNS